MLDTHQQIIGMFWANFSPSDNPRWFHDYLGCSKDYLIRFSCGVRCVKSDWICLEELRKRPDRWLDMVSFHVIICRSNARSSSGFPPHIRISDRKYSTCVGGTLRTNARLICRLSCETKQYPIRKQADRRRKLNKLIVIAQHKSIWTLLSQFLTAITKDWDFAITLKP